MQINKIFGKVTFTGNMKISSLTSMIYLCNFVWLLPSNNMSEYFQIHFDTCRNHLQVTQSLFSWVKSSNFRKKNKKIMALEMCSKHFKSYFEYFLHFCKLHNNVQSFMLKYRPIHYCFLINFDFRGNENIVLCKTPTITQKECIMYFHFFLF